MISRMEMERVGVKDINVLDRFVEDHDEQDQPLPKPWRVWQPESGQTIDLRTAQNYIWLNCVRVDPPTGTQ
jgi:hypothetical protein